jgi:hypothetical protein
MPLQFRTPIQHLEVWSASGDGFSFVITYETPTGPGFRARSCYVASWRRLDESRAAIKIGGSPFRMFAKAHAACNTVLEYLTQEN